MFDGKTFLPVTGIPIRKMACISRLLALAEPVPFTVPILNAKSLTRDSTAFLPPLRPFASDILHRRAMARRGRGELRDDRGHSRRAAPRRIRNEELELSHVPGGGRASLGTQTAMQAYVFVLHHDPLGLGQR